MEKIKLKYKHEEMNGGPWKVKQSWYECDKTLEHRKFHGGIEFSKTMALKSFLKIVIDRGTDKELESIIKELDLT